MRRLILLAFVLVSAVAAVAAHKTTHIIFVMTDGLRWKEVFKGASERSKHVFEIPRALERA